MKKEKQFRALYPWCTALLVMAFSAGAAEIKMNPKTLDAFAGQYELGEVHFTFRHQGNGLTCQVPREGVFNLEAKSTDHFVMREAPDLGFTFKRDAKGKVTHVIFHKGGEAYEIPKTSDQAPQGRLPDLSKIPPRDPKARPNLVNLSSQYNARLDEFWEPDGTPDFLQQNHLGAMPRGVRRLGTVDFDVRGVVQLASSKTMAAGANLPKEVKGIAIDQKCRRLHFLHGTQWRVNDGTRIGSYVLHYSDGTQAELPIVYGEQVRDWWATTGAEAYEAKNARVAWKGSNAATARQNAVLRVFESTRDNPQPERPVKTIDFGSSMTDSAPFLIAITLE